MIYTDSLFVCIAGVLDVRAADEHARPPQN